MLIQSAGGIIAMLDEPNPKLQVLALDKLDQVVDSFWPEIADAVGKIETLFESETFLDRRRAALVASKVYFHLGSYEDAMMYALGAEDLFNVNGHTEYIETIITKCIDQYTKLRNFNADCPADQRKPIDPRLEVVVNRMFDRCFQHKQYKQALGIAIESRRMDTFIKAIQESGDPAALMAYCVRTVLSLIQNRKYRNEILKCLVELYSKLPQPDFINMCQCLIFLEDPQSVADILERLAKESPDASSVAFQIAFDLYESATQQYVGNILQSLRKRAPAPIAILGPLVGPSASTAGESTAQQEVKMEVDYSKPEIQSETGENSSTIENNEETSQILQKPKEKLTDEEKSLQERIERLSRILSGDETIFLHMQFLIKNNHTDMLILKNIKDAVRNSIGHNATVVANALMHAGTTCDDFLRENIDWVGKATNWAKFSAVGSLGVIHRGHEQDAFRLLESYLPKEGGGASSGFMEGGGLFALGLIHANHATPKAIDYLKKQLEVANSDNIRHGAGLGLGLAAMGTQRQDVYEQLRHTLYQDDAVAGEAAGLSMGLVMLGSKAPSAIQDMVAYAQETQHEKILRGLSVGIALVMYGRLEEADPLIESLMRDKDPNLRRSGVYTLAMAYCGTGNNQAVRKLLHIAVSDVNDDVRRAAVTCLGFLLFRSPEQCPTMVSLLSESYNAHVRYGAAIALGIACAGTGQKDAIALLEPLLNDTVNYVRQGCMIAMAFILVLQNEVTCPKVKEFRAHLTKVINDKHEEMMAKFGAIVAQGILDAGGRNVTISLLSRTGHTSMQAVVGMLIFLQYWYWFPLAHCICLALSPACLIGLNYELKMPKMEFISNGKPSLFAYPPPMEEKKAEAKERVEAAILSVTAKAKKREKQKQSEKDGERMDVDDGPPETPKEIPKETPASASKDEKKKEEEPAVKKEPEPNFEKLQNPARVMKQQQKVINLPADSRFKPVKDLAIGGIIMMRDSRLGETMEFVEAVKAGGTKVEEQEKEPEPPEPFEYKE